MKKLFTAAALLCASAPLGAQIINESFTGINTAVPDGSLSGLANQQTISGAVGVITDVNVTLSLSGTGFGAVNGDIYAYLSHGGETAILVNRAGRSAGNAMGYDDNGFSSVTFDDSAANGDVHNYRFELFGDHSAAIPGTPGALTGAWQPDGRYVAPTSVQDSSARTQPLSVFNGLNPNGAWTLFVADVASGGTVRLDSWSVQVAVPEPHETALASGVILGAFALWRRVRKTRLSEKSGVDAGF